MEKSISSKISLVLIGFSLVLITLLISPSKIQTKVQAAKGKTFYVGLYGHNFDYFEKSGFNAVILQYTRDRFENLDPNKGKERVDQFIKDFAKKPSYRIILDWAFFNKKEMCVLNPPKTLVIQMNR